MYCGVALPGSRGGALSLLFFCRRFLFQIKRKCRNAGSIYHLIIVHSEGKKRFLRGFRAAVAAAVRRGRRTLQVAPNRLQISIHQPVLSYYAALYMQKVPADITAGTDAVLLSFGMQCSLILLKFLLPAAYLHLSLGKLFKCFKVAHCGFLGESRSSFEKFLIHLFLLLAV